MNAPKTPREAGEAAFYECEGNNATCLKAAFDAYEAAAKPARDELVHALKAMVLNDPHTYRDCHRKALAALSKAKEG